MARREPRGERQVLTAGRVLQAALDSGDTVRIELAARDLERAGQAREHAFGSELGFDAADASPGEFASVDPDAELEDILGELEVGYALVSAGAAVEHRDSLATDALPAALDELEASGRRRSSASGRSVNARFDSAPASADPPLELARTSVRELTGVLISRTTSIAAEAIKGVAAIPASVWQPWVSAAGTIVGNLPRVGHLASLGLRAIRRAVSALLRLVPQAMRDRVTALAREWWDQAGAPAVAERLLGIDAALAGANAVLVEGRPEHALRTVADEVEALSTRHERAIDKIRRVVRLLAGLLGPLTAALATAAAWLYGAAGAGFVAAVAAAVWIGRDCLDTASGWDRVAGLKTILAGLQP